MGGKSCTATFSGLCYREEGKVKNSGDGKRSRRGRSVVMEGRKGGEGGEFYLLFIKCIIYQLIFLF